VHVSEIFLLPVVLTPIRLILLFGHDPGTSITSAKGGAGQPSTDRECGNALTAEDT
jgi:hypothetical protein